MEQDQDRALSYEECVGLLASEDVGRLVALVDGYPEVFPVNYGLDDRFVVFRSDSGTKLRAAHHRNVGFEVDHVDPPTGTGWIVMVQGMAEDIAERPPDFVTKRAHALEVQSWAAGDGGRLVRIIPARVTGRRVRIERVRATRPGRRSASARRRRARKGGQ